MNLINDEGFLEFPLFHGTSSIFLDSINKHGLGGKIKIDLKLLKDICGAHESLGKDNLWWLANSDQYNNYILTDRIVKGRSNYVYGELHLSASRITAENYALSKKYGSELLSYTIIAYEELKKNKSHKSRLFCARWPLP